MLSSSSVVPPGNCGIHGYHGRSACPNCSTSALTSPLAQSPQPGPASVSPAGNDEFANPPERAADECHTDPVVSPADPIRWLAEFFRIDLTPHDPLDWHGNQAENMSKRGAVEAFKQAGQIIEALVDEVEARDPGPHD